jgi:CRP-like cAMP-binding protein
VSQPVSVFEDLSTADLAKIRSLGSIRELAPDEIVFSEGDSADFIYFIESGRVSIFIQKLQRQEEVAALGPGDYFGEMAVFNRNRRTASVKAMEPTRLTSVDKEEFVNLMASDRAFGEKVRAVLARRNEELVLKESLIDMTGVHHKHLHVSIKGDPSLRETAFTRERYESPIDKVIDKLPGALVELLVNRCVYRVNIAFNSGEIHTYSIFDPFHDEIHAGNKLVDEAYIERHFPAVSYDAKAAAIRGVYENLSQDPAFMTAPAHLKNIYLGSFQNWEPITPEEIRSTVAKLPMLRNIPDFYLRNFTISMTQDALRMQFNCDGTHIVSAGDYHRFLEENIGEV